MTLLFTTKFLSGNGSTDGPADDSVDSSADGSACLSTVGRHSKMFTKTYNSMIYPLNKHINCNTHDSFYHSFLKHF